MSEQSKDSTQSKDELTPDERFVVRGVSTVLTLMAFCCTMVLLMGVFYTALKLLELAHAYPDWATAVVIALVCVGTYTLWYRFFYASVCARALEAREERLAREAVERFIAYKIEREKE